MLIYLDYQDSNNMAAINYSELLRNSAPSGGVLDIKNGSIGEMITSLLPWIFTISGIALLVFLIIGGLSYMTAGNDPKKMEGAKAKISSALVGFVIVFVSYWIVQIIGLVFNIPSIQSVFK